MRGLKCARGVIVIMAACGSVQGSGSGSGSGSLPDAAIGTAVDAASPLDAPTVVHTVSVALAGNGTGSVTSTPANIDCPGQCSMTVVEGAQITIAAVP
jgi:hypothetical protein